MSATDSDVAAGPAVETSITLRRHLDVERSGGIQHWTLNEFDHGRSFMLICNATGVQFHAHFRAEDWAAFQDLIALEREPGDHIWQSAQQIARDHAANLTNPDRKETDHPADETPLDSPSPSLEQRDGGAGIGLAPLSNPEGSER